MGQFRDWRAGFRSLGLSVVAILGGIGSEPALVIGQNSNTSEVTQESQTPSQMKALKEVEQMKQLVIHLIKQERYTDAIPIAEQALAIRVKVLGMNHPDVADSLMILAALFQGQRRYAQALSFSERALSIREKLLGKVHPDVAISLISLAFLYRIQGNSAQALLLNQRALTISEKILREKHLDATSLNTLALMLDSQGKHAHALLLHQRALAIREKTLGKEHPDVAESLNNLAELYKNQRKYDQALPLYERALVINEKALGKEHLDVAAILNNLATLYQFHQKYTRALPLLQRALAIREKTLGKEHPDVAQSLNNLAELYKNQRKYDQALPLYERALAINKKALGKEHEDVARIYNNLATLRSLQYKNAQALPLYQHALEIYEKVLGKEHYVVATILENSAVSLSTLGQYVQTLPMLQRALDIREKVLGKEHQLVAKSLDHLATLYHLTGRYDKALPLFQRALAINEKVYGEEDPSVTHSLNNLAKLYLNMGNNDKALPLFQRALAINEKVYGEEDPSVAFSLNSLATLYHHTDNNDKALPLFQRALAINEKVYGEEDPSVAHSLNNLAVLYQDLGNYAQALPLYQRALAIKEKVYGEENPNIVIYLSNLARLYQVRKNVSRSTELITRVLNIEEKNLGIHLITGSEESKLAYMFVTSGTANFPVTLHLQDAPNNPQNAHLALTTVLRRKGRVLDALADRLQTLRQNLPPKDQAQLDQLAFTRSQLAALIYKGVGETPIEQYRSSVAVLKNKSEQLENYLSERSARFRIQSQPVTLAAVQQQIPRDTALVELVLYNPFNTKATKRSNKWGAPRYAAYILQAQGSLQGVDLGEASSINQAVIDLRQAITARSPKVKAVARRLDQLLMQPVRNRLGHTRKILISPESQLNLIPFATLVDERNRYLVENYTITYLTSGRDLLRLSTNSSSHLSPVILANPNFDKSGNPQFQGVQQERNVDTLSSKDITQLQFGPLFGTAQEAEAIAKQLPKAKLLTGSKATENALKQLKNPQILHIATHGFFLDFEQIATSNHGSSFSGQLRAGISVESSTGSLVTSNALPKRAVRKQENPLLRSGLALAGFNSRQSGDQDGVLTALEAASLNLQGTQLVILSACETGVGKITHGEGVYGLRRAFAIAGAQSQLISLWKVSDEGTKDLMVQYYKRLLANQGRSEALRQVQLEMLKDSHYSHPYFWASFIPSGDWRPMNMK